MDCKKIQHVIFRYIYGESDEVELRMVKAHLDRCTECRREREIIAGILSQVRGCFSVEEPPPGLREKTLDKVKSDLRERDAG